MINNNLNKRFLVTLIVNLIKAFLGFFVGMVLAKGLGVVEYGRFSFLLATFISVMTLIDMGTSNAFYTFISKSKQNIRFYCFYFLWISFQFLMTFLILFFIIPDDLFDLIFVGESRFITILAFCGTFFQQQIWNMLSQLAEASRDTFKIQKISFWISIVNFFIIVSLYCFYKLSIEVVFSVLILQYLFVIIFCRKLFFNYKALVLTESCDFSISSVLVRFKKYCTPLIIYSLISFSYQFLDAWLLQFYSGSAQQAFYSIASKIAAVSLIFSSSLVKVLWKEIADAEQNKDFEKIQVLYFQSTRMLYFVGVFITAFFVPWSKDVVITLLDDSYKEAALPFAIMLFYPIHQSLGQISGVMFYAMEKTKIFSKISVIGMIISGFVSFVLLSDGYHIIPGLGLGAVGLSLKMVLTQIISVNLAMFFIAKIKSWKFDWCYQVYQVLIMMILSSACYYLVSLLDIDLYYRFFLSGFLYVIFTLFIVYFFSMRFFNIPSVFLKEKVFFFLDKKRF
tara:strand:- start:4559 stop:6082 length:1524 start_codon:yes stop_codon:yes gene_type:complete